jgi:hypothetical protein
MERNRNKSFYNITIISFFFFLNKNRGVGNFFFLGDSFVVQIEIPN